MSGEKVTRAVLDTNVIVSALALQKSISMSLRSNLGGTPSLSSPLRQEPALSLLKGGDFDLRIAPPSQNDAPRTAIFGRSATSEDDCRYFGSPQP